MNKSNIKKLIVQLDLQLRHRIPLIHQTESSECGLACLAMICGFFGKNIDMIALRRTFNLSARGTTLSGLIGMSEQLGLASRPLSLSLAELTALRTPCILHWEFNHFVVLVRVKHKHVILHDPASGRRVVKLEELSNCFTGVALELWPGSSFTADRVLNRLSLGELINNIHGFKRALSKIFCLSLVIEVINLLLPIGTQLVMDHAIPAGDRGLISLISIGLMLFILLRTAISMLRAWSSLIMTTLINIQWHAGLFKHLLRLPLSYFERRKLGDIQSRFGSLSTICEAFTSSILGAIMDSIMVINVVVMMILYGGWLFWIVLGFNALYVVIRLLTYNRYRQLSEEALVRGARAQSYFMETLYGIATIKTQGMSERRGAHWLNLEVDTVNTEIKITKLDLFFGGINTFISVCDHVLILWLGTNLVIDNSMTLGMFIAFGAFREQFSGRVYSLTSFALQLRMMSLHNERISDIALHPPAARRTEIEFSATMLPASLEVRNLCFRYDSQSSKIFDNFSIAICRGESVAITGHSGVGKTTFMKILCGLFEPDSGKIIFNGEDIQDIGVNNYQKMIGCIMQDDKLFSGSIRENICGFDEIEDENWMIECAKASYIHDVILSMPMGYDTLLGELGEGLSGGQKQRIFIARALYRKPSIIFMDEATSSLDHNSEAFINKAIKQLKITRIIIAHRETTIATADRVISLSNLPTTTQSDLI